MSHPWKNPYELDADVDFEITHRAYPGGQLPRYTGVLYDGSIPDSRPRRALAGTDLPEGLGALALIAGIVYVAYRGLKK